MYTGTTLEPRELFLGLPNLDALFSAAKKDTVIRLRWPLVILCSYLLLYSPHALLPQGQVQAILLFYLLSNATLYFVADDRFDSPYFYSPLLLFDTLFLALCLAVSGAATADFYIACFVTLGLSCLCHDSRGLILVTLLAPILYSYVVLSSAQSADPSVYLRLPFPFVIAMFYGYFAQVDRLKKTIKAREQQTRERQQTAKQIQRQQERLKVLHEINLAVTSTLDLHTILGVFLEKTLLLLPYAAASVRLLNKETGKLQTAVCKNIDVTEYEDSAAAIRLGGQVVESRAALMIRNTLADPAVGDPEFFRRQNLVSYLGVPLISKGEQLGVLAFYTRQQHEFSSEEVGFLSSLAGQVAIAIYNSQLFEQTKRQAHELEDANKIKDEFLGVVSHELKTPLNVICGYTNMLVDRMMGEISPMQEKALQTVVKQSKDLQSMINCILQVSSIEADMLHADIHEVNFWEFLYELKSFYDYPLEKDVRVVWDFSSDLPILNTDRGKLKHILQNLINNAIKFTDQGSVTISARYLAAKKSMEFKVADSGIGIPRELLSSIFERFRQLDSSETRAHGGIGLGLYIVKKYTDLLGGTVLVESKPGKGSTFTLRLPCQSRKSTLPLQRPAVGAP